MKRRMMKIRKRKKPEAILKTYCWKKPEALLKKMRKEELKKSCLKRAAAKKMSFLKKPEPEKMCCPKKRREAVINLYIVGSIAFKFVYYSRYRF